MPKESTIQHYTSSTTGSAPTSGNLASGELAINTADEKIFYKNHVGTVLSLSQTKDLSGAFAPRSGVVTSVNGATGNIVSIATTGSNVFTGLNTFNAGLSAANLFVSGGATFGTSVSISGGTAWHSLNDGKGSGLDADFLRGINGDRYLEEIQSGLLYGGVLSINGTTGFNVSAGAGIVLTVNASLTGFPTPTLTNVTWNSFTGQSVLGLTSGDFTFVRIDSSGNLQQSTSDFTQTEYLNSVVLGNLVHPSRSDIDRVHSHPIVAYASSAQYETFIRYFGPLKVSGYAMSGFGTTGQVQVSSGVAFALGANMITDPNNPSVVTDSASVPLSTFYYLYRNADGSYKTDPTTSTIVSFNKYDDGDGTLGTISNNNWSIQRVYKIPGSSVVYVYYGRNSYSTSTTATAAILTESFDEADITLKNGVFLGWLIVRGGGSNVTSTGDCVIIPGGFFRNTTGGGGAATISSLDDLSDVTITSPSSNQILRYDGTQGLWVNSAVTTLPLVTSINGITGAVQVTGSGAILHTVSGTTTTLGARLATTAVTGVASFNNVHFTVDTTGHVQLAPAFQATGDTVITVAGSGIGIVTSGRTDTLYNIGVTSFNGFTGAVQVTGSGAILHTVSGTTTTLGARLATTAVTGVASFNTNDFVASTTGHVSLTGTVARTNTTNNFSAVQAFPNGLSAQGATFAGMVSVADFLARTVGGDEGGEIKLGLAQTNTTLTGNAVTIDVYQNRLRIFESGGSARGYYMDLSAGSAGAGSQLATSTPYSPPLATTSVTGVASFNNVHFTVDTTGHVQLAAAYQATGDTVITVAGSGIGIVTSGKTDTLYNIGVTSFNGLTGNVSLTGDGGSSLVLGNTVVTNRIATTSATGVASFNSTYFSVSNGAVSLAAAYQATGSGIATVPLATTSLTGTASFNPNRFQVSATGNVDLLAAYQATGDTVITVAGSGIGIVTSGKTDTLYNIGVTSFNGLTGNVSLTGDGGSSLVLGNTVVTNRIATTAATGVASFNSTYFTVSNGAVSLAAAYQATGGGIATVPLATTSLTGTASFNPNRFQVSATGNVDLLAAYQATGDTVITVAGSGIGIATSGKTDTLYNIGVTSFNGLTGNVSMTGDGGSSLVLGNTVVTNRLATTSLTGVASFNSTYFTVSNGAVSLASAYQATGAAGADTQIQFNASGSLSANNGLFYTSDTEILTIGSSNRHIEIIPGVDNFVSALGNSNLRLTQSGGNPITIGDFDGTYGGNNTYISVDDTSSLIAMYAATVTLNSTLEVGFDARVLGGLSANSLFVSTGATFAGNISAKNIVNSVNGLTGAITLTSGSNITLTPSGNTITIASTASGGGGISRSISTITTSTSAGASASYDYVFIGATSGNINLTLPTAVSNTNRYSVKQSNAVGTLTLLTTSSQTIDGLTAFALNKQYQAVDLISDNANWHIL